MKTTEPVPTSQRWASSLPQVFDTPQAEEAKRRAAAADERFDRLQQRRIAEGQEAAARASEAAQVAGLEAEARQPLWRRIFRRRGRA